MNRLKELRKARGLTTTELGNAVGCSNPAITHYEHGDRKPTPELLVKFADFFGVTVDYILGREEETPASVHTPGEQSEAERELLTLFRELSPYLQDLTLQTVRNWAGKAGKPGYCITLPYQLQAAQAAFLKRSARAFNVIEHRAHHRAHGRTLP